MSDCVAIISDRFGLFCDLVTVAEGRQQRKRRPYPLNDNISQQEMENANHAFIKWYQDWAKANGVDNNLKEIKATPTPKTEKEKEVTKAPASTTVKNEIAEAKTESLGKAMSKSTKTTKTEKTNKNTKKQK